VSPEVDMYSRVDWFKPGDAAILNLLCAPKPLEMTPSNIARNIDYSRGYVSERCSVLLETGLLDVDRDGTDPYYSATELGESLVNRELSEKDLREIGEVLEDDDES